tara:strand:+ start:31 stop:1035 length:1005 start_codon:yes stop_codon:yes gene_type:complete
MRDFYNLNNYHYGKSSKKAYNRGKSFGYQILGFGSGVAAAGFPPPQRGIMAFGNTGSAANTSRLINTSGVISADVTGVGTARTNLQATGFGGDQAIFAYGLDGAMDADNDQTNVSNKVSNVGVVASDTSGVGTARHRLGGCRYGGDKGMFAFGSNVHTAQNMKNLVSNTGVVASDAAGVGTARYSLPGTEYGDDLGIFAFGYAGGNINISSKVSNTGVVASDTSGVGTARRFLAASKYGVGLAIFGYGADEFHNVTNKVSNVGVVASDTTGVGTARYDLTCSEYGGDKAVFAFGFDGSSKVSLSNLVSNVGTVASDTTGVGAGRSAPAGSGYSV